MLLVLVELLTKLVVMELLESGKLLVVGWHQWWIVGGGFGSGSRVIVVGRVGGIGVVGRVIGVSGIGSRFGIGVTGVTEVDGIIGGGVTRAVVGGVVVDSCVGVVGGVVEVSGVVGGGFSSGGVVGIIVSRVVVDRVFCGVTGVKEVVGSALVVMTELLFWQSHWWSWWQCGSVIVVDRVLGGVGDVRFGNGGVGVIIIGGVIIDRVSGGKVVGVIVDGVYVVELGLVGLLESMELLIVD